MKRLAALVLAAALVSAAPPPDPLEAQGRRFVVLATSLGHLYPHEIDAYWGPPELDMRSRGPAPSLLTLRRDLTQLRGAITADAPSPRRDRLAGRLDHLIALLDVIAKLHAKSFDDEARAIYGVVVPPPDSAAQARAREKLNRLLPGHGDLASRLSAWRARFSIPDNRRREVFLRALAECRARTLPHWPLPKDEHVDVVWNADVPAAWQRYQGHDRSRLEINPAAVADPGTALDVACHEAYPGHHAQFLMMAGGGVVVEDTVVILRSPDQVLREGAANAGIDLAFPLAARLAFTRDVLFPLVGFNRRDAAAFVQVHRLVADMALSVMPILRDYYDGRMASGDAMARLVMDAQVVSPEPLLEFTRDTGAFVLGYTVERQTVANCLMRQASNDGRWALLRAMAVKLTLSCS
ncbi:MAG TPA: hypothetical protein VFQ52_06045 [Rhizomicrobium sp.]|nr:hypothetical protein [Rhizomicrobium sp.]